MHVLLVIRIHVNACIVGDSYAYKCMYPIVDDSYIHVNACIVGDSYTCKCMYCW